MLKQNNYITSLIPGANLFCTFDRYCLELKNSHAAYNHLADHCRLRKGVAAAWLRETGAQNAQEQEELEEPNY